MVQIIVNKYISVSKWKWKLDEICGICQQELIIMCGKCEHPSKCIPTVGMCTHTFHYHCIMEWLAGSTECPMCRSAWVVKKLCKEK